MQATIDGPATHPLAKADGIKRIKSNPATWIHDSDDSRGCDHCGNTIQLAEGEYIVVTLTTDRGSHREKSLVRVCSEECYRDWVTEARKSGWE